MSKNLHTEKIDLYLSHRMSEEERVAFETVLKNQPELMQEINKRQLERKVVGTLVKKEYAEKIKNWMPSIGALEKEFTTEEKKTILTTGEESKEVFRPDHRSANSQKKRSILPPYWKWAAAAVLLLAVAVPLIWNQFNSRPALPTLYAEYLEKPANPAPLTRGGDLLADNKPDSLWKQAAQHFSSGEFQSVIQSLESIIDFSSDPLELDQAYFYLGTSYLMAEQLEKAISALQKVNKERTYGDQALWYLALAYMKQEDEVQALAILESIAQSERHYKRKQAHEILDLLD